MKTFYYYQLLRKTIIQFLDLFNDIWVAHYDADTGAVTKRTLVPLKYGPKEKAYIWLKEYSTEEKLPIMMVNLMGIDLDTARIANKNQQIITGPIETNPSTGKMTAQAVYSPTPYTITFNLNIWALHMVDIDQILEQILPYFCPHVMTKITIPEINTSIEVKVVFNSATPDMSDDWAEEDWRVLKWTLTFTVQTWLFRGAEDIPIAGEVVISEGDLSTLTDATSSAETSAAWKGSVVGHKNIEGLSIDEDALVIYKYEQWDGDMETPPITGAFDKDLGTGKYGTINRFK